jgi:ADP-ribosylglycohydrolase
MVGTAAGDALGAGYEFGPALGADVPVFMNGGGMFRWEPGEWTDDTSMAIAVAEAADFGDLRDWTVQDVLVQRWCEWARTAKDVGSQTSSVLRRATGSEAARKAAREFHQAYGKSGGNGSLMRTAPVALAYLHWPHMLTDAAIQISGLTHYDPEAAEACVLWCHATRHAVLTGELDARAGMDYLVPSRAVVWQERLEVAERSVPSDFKHNGWVVEALQSAWCAISTTSGPNHLQKALEAAVRGGRDTDTVAAIAGGLLGAAYGDRAVPRAWRERLHGWPGMTASDLGKLAMRIVRR